MRKLTLILAAMLLCSSAIAAQHQPYFRDFPEMTFACENSQVENDYVALKVDTMTSTLYIYHGADHIAPYRINSSSAVPDMHATDEFGVPLKTLPWDMVMLLTNDQHVLMNKPPGAGVWYVREHDNYYQCIPSEPRWRAYETLDPPK